MKFFMVLYILGSRRAKEVAVAEALPTRTLKWIESAGEELVQIALWIGKCTVAANRFLDPSCSDPLGKARFLRDSEGLAVVRRQSYKAARKRKMPELSRQPPRGARRARDGAGAPPVR